MSRNKIILEAWKHGSMEAWKHHFVAFQASYASQPYRNSEENQSSYALIRPTAVAAIRSGSGDGCKN